MCSTLIVELRINAHPRVGFRLRWLPGRTLDLDDSSDSFRAGLDALISEDESERIRGRILRTVPQQAAKGAPHGKRLYGYKRKYDPNTGAQRRVKRLLTNPAYIGTTANFSTPSGRLRATTTIRGGCGRWILDEKTFNAIAARYDDPARAKYRGGHDVKYLLSGIARCGRCGAHMYRGHDRKNRLVYSCKAGLGHITRSLDHLDAYVTTVVLERLKSIDFDDLTAENPEAAEARAEAAELRERLNEAAATYAAGEISTGMLTKIEARLLPEIKAAERRARAAAVSPAVSDLAGEGVDRRWDRLTIEQRREIIRLLLDITVLPSKRPTGSRGFDPDAIRLEWKI
jgi:site-specific DNA recombinase